MSNSAEILDKQVQRFLNGFIPIQHEHNDYQTCSSLYHECSYPDAKKASKTVRQFANGYVCIAKSYFNSSKECRHPRKYWNPGKCDCGAVREQREAKAQIKKLLLQARQDELRKAESIIFDGDNTDFYMYFDKRQRELSVQEKEVEK